MRSRSLTILLLPLALLLGSCSGDEEKDVQELLDKAFTRDIRSADLKLNAEIDVKGAQALRRPVRIQASGPFRAHDDKLPAVDLELSIDAGSGQPVQTGFVSTGDRAFVKFQEVFYEQPRSQVEQANRAIRQGGRRRGSLKALGLNPRSWLQGAEDDGDEEVAGVETTHISGKLDVAAVVRDFNDFVKRSGGALGGATGQVAPRPLSQSELDKITDVVEDPSFDVYVGKDDDIIRRISGRIEFDVPEADRGSVGGIQGGTFSFSLEFAKTNGNQQIDAPARARPISDLTNSLGSGAAPVAPGGGDSGRSDDFKRYAECIDRAKPEDTDALQRCAELLK